MTRSCVWWEAILPRPRWVRLLRLPKFFFDSELPLHHSSMRVFLSTLTGVEVARVDTDATVTLVKLLALWPKEVGDIECSRRIFFGETELKGYMNLSDIGVEEDSVLTIVFGPILRLLTASQDWTAKVWSAGSGVSAHLGGSQPSGHFCSFLGRRPAGADRIP